MNPIPIRFLIHRIKMNRNPDKFSPGRVGAYCIRPTNGHARGRMNGKIAIFSGIRVGAYCIRPTDDHGSGRTNPIPIRFLIHRIKMNRKPAGFFIPRPKRNPISTRFSNPQSKMNLKSIGFFNPGPKGMALPGA